MSLTSKLFFGASVICLATSIGYLNNYYSSDLTIDEARRGYGAVRYLKDYQGEDLIGPLSDLQENIASFNKGRFSEFNEIEKRVDTVLDEYSRSPNNELHHQKFMQIIQDIEQNISEKSPDMNLSRMASAFGVGGLLFLGLGIYTHKKK